MTTARTVRLAVGVLSAALVGACAQTAALAQCCTWVSDASTSAENDDGSLNVTLAINYGGYSYSVYGEYLDSEWIPGLTVSPYTDCNCNYQAGGAQAGYWGFDSQFIEEGDWYEVYWDFYVPELSSDQCSSCPNCDSPVDEFVCYEYYDQSFFYQYVPSY